MTPVRVLTAVGLLVAAVLLVAGLQAKERPKVPKASSVLVELTVDHAGGPEYIRINDEETVRKLEACFPNYAQRPVSDVAAGWERGACVYFDLPDGQSIRVSISHPGNGGDLWSTGQGDHRVTGNFYRLLEAARATK